MKEKPRCLLLKWGGEFGNAFKHVVFAIAFSKKNFQGFAVPWIQISNVSKFILDFRMFVRKLDKKYQQWVCLQGSIQWPWTLLRWWIWECRSWRRFVETFEVLKFFAFFAFCCLWFHPKANVPTARKKWASASWCRLTRNFLNGLTCPVTQIYLRRVTWLQMTHATDSQFKTQTNVIWVSQWSRYFYATVSWQRSFIFLRPWFGREFPHASLQNGSEDGLYHVGPFLRFTDKSGLSQIRHGNPSSKWCCYGGVQFWWKR